MQATPETIARYIAHMANTYGVGSIQIATAAIKKAFNLNGLESPTTHPHVKAVMAGITRTKGKAVTRKAPATAPRVKAMIATGGDNTLIDLRDKALIGLGFAAALRRSEIAALQVTDLEWTDNGLLVHIRKSKTDQEGKGATVAIPYGAMGIPEAVKAWLQAAGITDGHVFRASNKWGFVGADKPMTGSAIAYIIKKRAEAAGLDPAIFSGHSLRAGFVTSAAESRADLLKIMDQTRHASVEMVRRYVREANVWDGHAGASFL
jgi:integrase